MGVNWRRTLEFVLFYRNSSLLRLLKIVKFLECDHRGRKYEMAGYERRGNNECFCVVWIRNGCTKYFIVNHWIVSPWMMLFVRFKFLASQSLERRVRVRGFFKIHYFNFHNFIFLPYTHISSPKHNQFYDRDNLKHIWAFSEFLSFYVSTEKSI